MKTIIKRIFGLAAVITAIGLSSYALGEVTKASQFFNETNIWTASLKFSADQWDAIEPQGGGFGRGGPGGGPGRMGGGPGGFGPATMVVPAFMQAGQDGKISRAQFSALGEQWFSQWDTNKAGKLTPAELGAGLNTTVGQPGMGGRPGPGGPGGPSFQSTEGKRNGMSAASGIDFQYVHADLELDGKPLTNVAVRYKGNNTYMESRNSIKRSLKIDLDKFTKDQKLAKLSKINLHNNITDASWMNEVLSHQLFRDARVPAPRTSYARLYVTVPGKYDHKYFGLYSIVENIDERFLSDRHYAKGAIFKPVERSVFTDLGTNWSAYKQRYDPKTKTTPAQEQRVMEFARFVTSASDADFAAHVGDYLDLDEFARFMAVTVWLSNLDSLLAMGQNYYVYLNPATQKFEFWPWDLDHSFGQFPMMGSQEQREKLSIDKPWSGENRFLERVYKVESFKKIYLARMKEFSETIFKPERIQQQVDTLAAILRPSVKEESETLLTRFDKLVAGQSLASGPGGPAGDDANRPMGGRGGPGGFGQASKPIKPFVTARASSVQNQLNGTSRGETLNNFGGPGGRGGFGGPGGQGGRGGRGGQGGFGPAMFLQQSFVDALDADHNSVITHEEFSAGFAKWFDQWDTQKTGTLTEAQLRAGVEKTLTPSRGNSAPPGFGPPDGNMPPPGM